MSMMKWVIGIIAVILVVWGITAATGDRGPAETGPIVIGFVGPLTGDGASYGEPARNVTALAVKQVNEAGGINGRMLEVIYEDSACSGTEAANAINKLINIDGVKIITGWICSTATLAGEPIATENRVFMLSQAASSPDLTGISPLFARTYPSDSAQGKVLADVAYNNKGWRKVAFIQESLDYPLGIFNAFNESFVALGGETVKEEFPSSETDFRTSLTKLRQTDSDALFIDTQTPAVGERVIKQFSELGWNVPLLINDALAGDSELVSRNSDVLEGTLAAEFSIDKNNEQFQLLLSSYLEEYGTELPFQSYGQTEYDAVLLLADAITAVGEDPEAVAQWVRDVEGWIGASGNVDIGENGDPESGHVPKVIINGKTELYQAE